VQFGPRFIAALVLIIAGAFICKISLGKNENRAI
jgi:hypothetical protein